MAEHRFLYADNAATTPLSPAALRAMEPFLTAQYGNPSSLYRLGQEARRAVEQARRDLAACLHADPEEILFTSGGTESDNWALRAAAHRMAAQGKRRLITSSFEHPAVLHTCRALEQEGFSVTWLPVHGDGLVRPEEVESALREDTALVSIMAANNEIGTVQPVEEIGRLCRAHGVLFHTDAVQAAGNLPIDVKRWQCDLLSVSAHKFHGPKGMGLLWRRKGLELLALLTGGEQERGLRPGTENTAGIVGMAAALQDACASLPARTARLCALRDRLAEQALRLPVSRLNGSRDHRLPGTVNLSFAGTDGEQLLLLLDLQGIAVSTGSACESGSHKASHVLLALGLPEELARGSLRFSLGEDLTEADIDYMAEKLAGAVQRIRLMNPLWERIESGRIRYSVPGETL